VLLNEPSCCLKGSKVLFFKKELLAFAAQIAICYKPASVPGPARNASLAKPKSSDLPAPQWDGSRVLFQIEVAGETVDCAISRGALQDLGGWRHYAPADLLRCFMNARARIEKAAADKFASQAESVYGVVSIWSDDLEDAPPDSVNNEPQGEEHGQGTAEG